MEFQKEVSINIVPPLHKGKSFLCYRDVNKAIEKHRELFGLRLALKRAIKLENYCLTVEQMKDLNLRLKYGELDYHCFAATGRPGRPGNDERCPQLVRLKLSSDAQALVVYESHNHDILPMTDTAPKVLQPLKAKPDGVPTATDKPTCLNRDITLTPINSVPKNPVLILPKPQPSVKEQPQLSLVSNSSPSGNFIINNSNSFTSLIPVNQTSYSFPASSNVNTITITPTNPLSVYPQTGDNSEMSAENHEKITMKFKKSQVAPNEMVVVGSVRDTQEQQKSKGSDDLSDSKPKEEIKTPQESLVTSINVLPQSLPTTNDIKEKSLPLIAPKVPISENSPSVMNTTPKGNLGSSNEPGKPALFSKPGIVPSPKAANTAGNVTTKSPLNVSQKFSSSQKQPPPKLGTSPQSRTSINSPKVTTGLPKPGGGPPKPGGGPPKPGGGPPKPGGGLSKPGGGPPRPSTGPLKPGAGSPRPVIGPPRPGMGPPKLAAGSPKPGNNSPSMVSGQQRLGTPSPKQINVSKVETVPSKIDPSVSKPQNVPQKTQNSEMISKKKIVPKTGDNSTKPGNITPKSGNSSSLGNVTPKSGSSSSVESPSTKPVTTVNQKPVGNSSPNLATISGKSTVLKQSTNTKPVIIKKSPQIGTGRPKISQPTSSEGKTVNPNKSPALPNEVKKLGPKSNQNPKIENNTKVVGNQGPSAKQSPVSGQFPGNKNPEKIKGRNGERPIVNGISRNNGTPPSIPSKNNAGPLVNGSAVNHNNNNIGNRSMNIPRKLKRRPGRPSESMNSSNASPGTLDTELGVGEKQQLAHGVLLQLLRVTSQLPMVEFSHALDTLEMLTDAFKLGQRVMLSIRHDQEDLDCHNGSYAEDDLIDRHFRSEQNEYGDYPSNSTSTEEQRSFVGTQVDGQLDFDEFMSRLSQFSSTLSPMKEVENEAMEVEPPKRIERFPVMRQPQNSFSCPTVSMFGSCSSSMSGQAKSLKRPCSSISPVPQVKRPKF